VDLGANLPHDVGHANRLQLSNSLVWFLWTSVSL
jgi:hypothetical protein